MNLDKELSPQSSSPGGSEACQHHVSDPGAGLPHPLSPQRNIQMRSQDETNSLTVTSSETLGLRCPDKPCLNS